VKFLRVLLLGAVAIGIVLALTSTPSSGSGAAGQATGYGDDVIQPCPPGQDTAPGGGPCLVDLEVATGETAGAQGDDDGGLDGTIWLLLGLLIIILGGGTAWVLSHRRA